MNSVSSKLVLLEIIQINYLYSLINFLQFICVESKSLQYASANLSAKAES